MTDVVAPAAPATGADAPAAAPDGQVRISAPAEGAPPAKQRPESPLTWDEASERWVAKTKVDGKESVVPWEDLHRDAQLSRSAQERFEEAKAIKRRNDELTRAAMAYQEALRDPTRAFEAWQAMKLDPHKMLEQMYAHAEAEAKITPEQRELRAYRAQEQQRLEQERQATERQRAEQEEAEEREQDARYDRAFTTGMTKLGVPEDPMLRGHLSHMLWAMHDRATAEGKKMGIGEAVTEAVGSMKGIMKSVAGMMKADELAALLGPELVDALVQARVAGAAPIPEAVPHHSSGQGRSEDGRFAQYTTFRPGTNPFGRVAR